MIFVLTTTHSIYARPTLWSDNASTQWYDDAITEDADVKEFFISTEADLAGLASLVNSGKENFEGKSIKLNEDLDLEAYYWVPIGVYTSPGPGQPLDYSKTFQGNFNGNGKSISGLKISDSENYEYAGLFGYIYATNGNMTAGIKDLVIENGSIRGGDIYNGNSSSAGALSGVIHAHGKDMAAAVTIENCSNSTSVSGGYSHNQSSYAGGLIGQAISSGEGQFSVLSCTNSGEVLGSESSTSSTGGIVGSAQGYGSGTIASCENFASIKGRGIRISNTGGDCRRGNCLRHGSW